MTRTQAMTFTIILGFFLLGLIGVVFLLLFPYELVFVPTPTITSTFTVTPTATIERFLPTTQPDTPTPGPPTETSTRVPSVTPLPTKTPVPDTDFSLPTPFVRPTATPTLLVPIPEGTAEPTATNVPARQFSVRFSAKDAVIDYGRCTELNWAVEGQAEVWLDGKPVEPAGQQEICPERDTEYTLEVRIAEESQVARHKVRVRVE